jgi:TonB family protein
MDFPRFINNKGGLSEMDRSSANENEGASRYGSTIPKLLAQKYTTIGLAIAVGLHLAGVGTYWVAQYLSRAGENSAPVVMLRYSELGPPPSITNQQSLPEVAVSTPMAKPNVGIPVPVPDAEVSPEQTIASQQELSRIAGPVSQNGGSGDSLGVSMGNFTIPADDGPPPDFVPVEKEPQIVKEVKPAYPEIAMKAGIEGRVIVKIWIDRNGKPRKAIVMKSDVELFNLPSINAAMQYRYTPAIMNKGPVEVWVVIPFTFKLVRQ